MSPSCLLRDLRKCLTAGLLLAFWLLPARGVLAAEAVVDVHLQSGVVHSGRLLAWTAEAVQIAAGEAQTVALEEIARIEFSRQVVQPAAGAFVSLVTGDRLAIAHPRIVEEQLQARWSRGSLRPELSLPLEGVAGLLLEMPPEREVLFQELVRLGQRVRGHDTVRLLTGDDLQGELQGLDGGLVDFQAALGAIKLDLRRLRSIGLDPELATIPELPAEYWIVLLADGSRWTIEALRGRDDGTVQLVPLEGEPCFVNWSDLASATQITSRWQPLSQRNPAEVEYAPWVGEGEVTWQADRNLRRQPLVLRGREFAVGLGVTSRMRLTYRLEPEDAGFQATVGLDDLAPATAGCEFRVELDGQTVWQSGDVFPAEELRVIPEISLQGHQTLSLVVDYGPRGDVADLANWCAAMIRRVR